MEIIEELRPHLNAPLRRTRIPVHVRVLTAMYFFATGCYQRASGQSVVVNISQSQVCRSIHEVANAICTYMAHRWICFPQQDDYNLIKEKCVSFSYCIPLCFSVPKVL